MRELIIKDHPTETNHNYIKKNLYTRIKGVKWRVGCGDSIKFWEDMWLDGETEKSTDNFPSIIERQLYGKG